MISQKAIFSVSSLWTLIDGNIFIIPAGLILGSLGIPHFRSNTKVLDISGCGYSQKRLVSRIRSLLVLVLLRKLLTMFKHNIALN